MKIVKYILHNKIIYTIYLIKNFTLKFCRNVLTISSLATGTTSASCCTGFFFFDLEFVKSISATGNGST